MTDRVERPASPEAAPPASSGPPLRRPRGPGRHTAPPTTEFALPGAVREREPLPAAPEPADPATLARRAPEQPPVSRRELEPLPDDDEDTDDEGGRGDGGVELALRLPPSLSAGLDARRAAWTQVDSAAAALTAITLVLILCVLFPGSLYQDDLIGQGNANGQGFWGYVLGADGSPFAPLPRALYWLQSRWFPLAHGPAVFVTLVVRFALAAAFWRLLRRLFGPRPAILLPFGVLLITPALLPATAWYRQSITVLAATIAVLWALDAMIRWTLEHRTADLVVVGAAAALGLACSEQAAVLPFVLLAAAAALFLGAPGHHGGHGRRGAGPPHSPFRTALLPAGVAAGVLVVFLLAYLVGPDDQGPRGVPSPFGVLRLAFDAVAGSIVPMLFGGPWRWTYPVPFAGTPEVPAVLAVICNVAVLAGLVLVARRTPRRAARAVLLAAGFVLPSAVVVASGRGGTSWAELADATRLWAGVVPGLLLAATLAALPWRLGAEATPEGVAAGTGRLLPAPTPATDGLQVTELVDGRPVAVPAAVLTAQGDPDDGAYVITPTLLAAGLAVLFVAGSALAGTWSYAQQWWDNPTDAWLAKAKVALAGAEPYPRFVATPLPEWVLPASMNARFPNDAPVAELIRPDVRLNDADGPARLINDGGELTQPLPLIVAASKPAVCAAAIPGGAEAARVPLAKAAPAQLGTQLDVAVLISRPTTIEVMVERPDGSLTTLPRQTDDELPKGPHTVRFALPPGVSVAAVRVTAPAPGAGCVTLTQAWVPAA